MRYDFPMALLVAACVTLGACATTMVSKGPFYKSFRVIFEPSVAVPITVYPVPSRAAIAQDFSGEVKADIEVDANLDANVVTIVSGSGNDVVDSEIQLALTKMKFALPSAPATGQTIRAKVAFRIINGRYKWDPNSPAGFAVCVETRCKDHSID